MVELVDTTDLKSVGEFPCAGSTPASGTNLSVSTLNSLKLERRATMTTFYYVESVGVQYNEETTRWEVHGSFAPNNLTPHIYAKSQMDKDFATKEEAEIEIVSQYWKGMFKGGTNKYRELRFVAQEIHNVDVHPNDPATYMNSCFECIGKAFELYRKSTPIEWRNYLSNESIDRIEIDERKEEIVESFAQKLEARRREKRA